MKIMYIAPRYHTNQAAIMKYLIENGNEVCFLSQYRGKIEDYTYIEPIIIGYSLLFKAFDKFYTKIIHRNNSSAIDMKLKFGFPPIWRLYKNMKEFNPDVVIIRERSVYSIFAYLICKCKKYPSILYNQSPLWEKEIKNDVPHKIVRMLTPAIRITPVYGNDKINKVKENKAYYVPFVVEPILNPEEKKYFQNVGIRLFSIGKYEPRKNHIMLIEAFSKLYNKYNLELVIAGECSSEFHQKYYDEVVEKIKYYDLEKKVKLLTNLSRSKINNEYKKADIFIIPSTKEPASISQLEAMAFSLPVICSDTNGTSCYIDNGINGYCFQDNNVDDLKNQIEKIVSDNEKLVKMGVQSYLAVKNQYSFDKYYKILCKLLESYYT